MRLWVRWGKFSMVGALGVALQLALLGLFNRWMAGHYLFASAAAIEITLLHNFVWHLHYTWRDRQEPEARLGQLLRFQISNGLVSLLGNLAVMRLLVEDAHVPVVLSNLAAIALCSLANFWLGDRWAFAARTQNFVFTGTGSTLAPSLMASPGFTTTVSPSSSPPVTSRRSP